MKSSRLLGYAIVGIVAGLLLENKFLTVKQDIKLRSRRVRNATNNMKAKASRLYRDI